MVEAVKFLPPEVLDVVELKVWDITIPSGIERKAALNVVRMPTMAINGLLAFESSIPSEEELIEAIKEHLD